MKEYIDKQELLKELRYDLENDCNVYCDNFDRIMRDRKYEFAIDVVQDASPVDAKEVVHAKWTKTDFGIICSVCGRVYDPFEIHSREVVKFKFCPECGAEMDKE